MTSCSASSSLLQLPGALALALLIGCVAVQLEYHTAEEGLERANQAQKEGEIEFINLALKRTRAGWT